ncbi:MAG: transposase [Thermodesulfobacteriota bacterium]
MARIARVVVPDHPHHITQRGNRRQQTFFSDDDYREYKGLMSEWCNRNGVEIWAYCLMANHTHLVAVPGSSNSLRRAIGEAHRRYTRYMNFQKGWRGYLWQGRFSSYPMDLLAAARYIEFNPVRAGLASRPGEYPWSSASPHLSDKDDELVRVSPLLGIVGDWRSFLSEDISELKANDLRRHEQTGRPLGSEQFISKIEEKLGRILHREKPGPKKKDG